MLWWMDVTVVVEKVVEKGCEWMFCVEWVPQSHLLLLANVAKGNMRWFLEKQPWWVMQ